MERDRDVQHLSILEDLKCLKNIRKRLSIYSQTKKTVRHDHVLKKKAKYQTRSPRFDFTQVWVSNGGAYLSVVCCVWNSEITWKQTRTYMIARTTSGFIASNYPHCDQMQMQGRTKRRSRKLESVATKRDKESPKWVLNELYKTRWCTIIIEQLANEGTTQIICVKEHLATWWYVYMLFF
jgi:hypothetical protein